MSILNTCAPAVASTHRSAPERWLLKTLELVTRAYTAWGEQTRARANWRAMQGLSDETLRDIGWAERMPQQPTLGMLDYERGRWQ